ncbi:hypothetical protein PsorP6_001042 [Peronosclerospora sorghi]|uniref:Uncharacterized protein n=1 Tax=Peronosclerospora sorghi TaxID=230839 RepID=A0ACC0WUN8_9STRA|nr:hypothetical protein PsorP6_001042 [Peronosclerospora sorghi]
MLQNPRGSQTQHEWVKQKVEDDLIVQGLKPKILVDHMFRKNGAKVSYHTAHKALEALRNESTEAQIANIRELNSAAAEYIDAIPYYQWASYAVSGGRFGYVTSNLAEIAN